MKVTKAVILAAGKGTRFLPYTKAYPKEMLAVIDKPSLQLIVEEVAESGIKDILIVVSPDKQCVVDHFTPNSQLIDQLLADGKTAEAESLKKLDDLANISFALQPEVSGTGIAVKLAKDFVGDQPFAVLNGDDVIFNYKGKPVTKQLADAFETCKKSVVGVQEVPIDQIGKYASCKVVSSKGRLHIISDIIEKPKNQNEIFSLLAPLGRYILTSDIFSVIDNTPMRNKKEVYLTDSLQIQARTGGIFAYNFNGTRFDFGNKLGYLKGVTEYAIHDKNFAEEYKQYLLELTKTF